MYPQIKPNLFKQQLGGRAELSAESNANKWRNQVINNVIVVKEK